jgi:hypothetical protein
MKASPSNTLLYTSYSPYSQFVLISTSTSGDKYRITDTFSQSDWIPGLTGTSLDGKWVYKTDVGSKKSWGANPSTLVSPQGATGLDTSPYNTYMTLVADESVDFTAYPARQACKDLGGRLPNTHELQAIYAGRASYGNNFNTIQYQGGYWTAAEYNSVNTNRLDFYTGVSGYQDKSVSNNVRCVGE